MCRWLAYSGSPVRLADVLYTPIQSFIDQSRNAKLGAETTNGDGFGIGWYAGREEPGVFHSTEPAWNDQNLHEVSRHITSPLFFSHIRAAIGSPVQKSNCHPFRHERWLWMHNGFIDGFAEFKRDLAFAVAPGYFPLIAGTTDSELMFYLALTFGLQDDPPEAVARMVGFVEAAGHAAGIEYPFQGTIVTSDGETLWAFRYSSEGKSRTLFFTHDVPTLRERYPDLRLLREVSEDAHLVVSEPIGNLPGAWVAAPEASYSVVRNGHDALRPFVPKVPA